MESENNKRNGKWIWTKDWTEEDKKVPRLIWFCTEIEKRPGTGPEKSDSDKEGSERTAAIRITADCRYKLYINGKLIQYGPAKGDRNIHYIDKAEIGRFLKVGSNLLAVAVLHYPEDPKVGNHSMFSSDVPGLYIEEMYPSGLMQKTPGTRFTTALCEAGDTVLTGWKSFVDRAVSFIREEERFAPLQIHEMWKSSAENRIWQPVIVRREEEMPAYLHRRNLVGRPIPQMLLKEHEFILPISKVEANSRVEFVLHAGEEMCAFPIFRLAKGEGSRISLLYSECYEQENGKTDRTDAVNGHLQGYSDLFLVGKEIVTCLEPYWFRTFRYIKVTIETAEEPLLLSSFTYLETGYPLEVKTEATTSDETLAPVWDISLRTLRRCMHETYVDCPYYEQLQYIEDTRLEILYTYAVSGDDRLARKTIREFAGAQRKDGLLNCSYPNKCINVIPGFSIYYILMVHDHMMYFGRPEVVREALPVIRRILKYFEENTIKSGPCAGLVDKTGGVNEQGELWSFIDWAQEWMDTTGMPRAGLIGPITMESLLYILGLQKAAELEEYAGEAELAVQDRMLAGKVQYAVRNFCMDEEGFLTDGPLVNMFSEGETQIAEQRSQHCQVFGILTGTLGDEEGRRCLLRSIRETGFAKCSVSMCFYLFRAMEKTGIYEYTDRYWNVWRQMVSNHCSTCVEAEFYARSECHAWGALALYELPSVVLGVRPAAPGYSRISVRPVPGYLNSASGKVHTPAGDLEVYWEKTGDSGVQLKISCAEEVREKIVESEELNYA